MPFSGDIREICSSLSPQGPGALGHHVNWAGQHACRHVRARLRYREHDPGLAPAARAIEASVGPLRSESAAERFNTVQIRKRSWPTRLLLDGADTLHSLST